MRHRTLILHEKSATFFHRARATLSAKNRLIHAVPTPPFGFIRRRPLFVFRPSEPASAPPKTPPKFGKNFFAE